MLAERVGDVHTRDGGVPDSTSSTSWIALLRVVESVLMMFILEAPKVLRGRSTSAGLAGVACAISRIYNLSLHGLVGSSMLWSRFPATL